MDLQQTANSHNGIVKSKTFQLIDKFIDAIFFIWIGYIGHDAVRTWRGHSAIFIARDIRSILFCLFGLMAIGAILMVGTLPFFRNDQCSDPLWKRGLRVFSCIITLSGILLALAYFRS